MGIDVSGILGHVGIGDKVAEGRSDIVFSSFDLFFSYLPSELIIECVRDDVRCGFQIND